MDKIEKMKQSEKRQKIWGGHGNCQWNEEANQK